MFKYLRYFGTHLLVWATAAGFLLGGAWYWLGLATGIVFWIGGDTFSWRIDDEPPHYAHPRVLDYALYSLFPSLVGLCVTFAWALSPRDLFAIGAHLQAWFDFDFLAARKNATAVDFIGASWSFALAIAMGGILSAHELTHRTHDPWAMWVGRWMLAMAFNASLEVAHVFGHHRDVGTAADPATARRNENVYLFFIRSTIGQVFQAWRIERERLGSHPAIGSYLRHRVVRGFARSIFVAMLYFAAGGVLALGVFLLSALWNKLLLETLNYIEHYGLVRVPDTPIEPRHAWDSDRSFCHAALFNLPFHADHHSRTGTRYPALHATRDAPRLDGGYLAMLPIALVPPLWRRLMAPKLAQWDRTRASAAECRLLGPR